MDASKLMFKPGLLEGERILVTGGGTGLGKEMAEAFLALGSEVIIIGRRGEVLKQTAEELQGRHGGKISPYPCDIRSSEAISEMLDNVWAAQGPITGLVNNAAGNFISQTKDLSPRGFEAISNIVFRGTFYMTLDVGKRWIAEGRKGNVLAILATFIWNGAPFMVPSAMSKAGVNAMTQSLAVEWARYGIRANAICPGAFPTEGASSRLNPQIEDKPRGETDYANPMNRNGYMHELCNLAVLLMGPGADYINGETIAIDGGAWLSRGGRSGLMSWTDEQWAAARASIDATNQKDRAKRTV